jgi:hypothetical protein
VLVEIARENINRYNLKLGKPASLEMICADASQYRLPREELVIYLFNPFGGATFSAFLKHLEESIRRCPRELYLVYSSPMCESMLNQSRYLMKIAGRKDAFAIYRAIGLPHDQGRIGQAGSCIHRSAR